MADNLKPYNPNKGFISFRLNPDAIKEALIEQVPYNRTLRYIYNNPEGDIRETAKFAASETPILGSLLAGEPVDAAKEAILFGAPIKSPSKAKAKIAKFKPGTEFGTAKGYEDLILAREPGSRKYKAYGIDDDTGELFRYNNSSYEGPSKYFGSAIIEDKPINATELSNGIDYTNAMFDKLPSLERKNPVAIANEDIGLPRYSSQYGVGFGTRGDNYNPLGTRIEEYDHIQREFNNAKQAKLRKGEELRVRNSGWEYEDPNVVIYNPNTNKYREVGSKYINEASPNDVFRPLPDNNVFDYDNKLLQDEINQRNQRVDFEDDVIPYKSGKQYYEDYKDAYNAYMDGLNGPFLEDILGIKNRYKSRDKM